MSGCKILGAVMNMVDPKESDVYGKYGKYGKYGYGVYGQAGK
jgi:Mrp family chromosome partitioning ATPase